MNAHNIYKYIKTLEIENKKFKALYDKAIHSDVQRFCELQKYEKALDKACEELENLSYVKGLGQVGRNYAEWKEWAMKDVE